VDAVIFRKHLKTTEVLLIRRGNEPFKDEWALPGGFVDMQETLEEAIVREVKEETNLNHVDLRQLHAFSAIDRDPRGRTISVVFWGVHYSKQEAIAGDDASDAKWFAIDQLPKLAFDHQEVIEMAIKVFHKTSINH
jgi:8-oxo-dGTP diphosphatase